MVAVLFQPAHGALHIKQSTAVSGAVFHGLGVMITGDGRAVRPGAEGELKVGDGAEFHGIG